VCPMLKELLHKCYVLSLGTSLEGSRWPIKFSCLKLQLANNTLERVAPLTHAVGNVLKRVFVIGFSIVVFGELSP
jgi:hypothetical protein